MDYARFDELRRPACDELERRLEEARRHPHEVTYESLEEIAFHYRQLLHDHALSAARYPGTSIDRRLRRLVLTATHYLQRDTGENVPGPRRFLTRIFPAAIRRISPLIAAMTGLFVVTALFGFCLATVEPALGASFLSPEAIAGLKRGRLWTEPIFAVTPGSVASGRIATNNLTVAVTAWAGGTLAGLGALYVVLMNGLMLGAVLATTARYSMLGPLFAFIAAHGPLELTLIVISAAAGLAVGKALVVADDRPRAELLREASRDALAVLVGCLPWILLLGFVEGFISNLDLGVAFKAALGLTLESLFLTVAFNPFDRSAEGGPAAGRPTAGRP